jgi:hypothetical protein
LLTNLAGEWRGFNRNGKKAAVCREIRRSFGLGGRTARAPLPHAKTCLRAGVALASGPAGQGFAVQRLAFLLLEKYRPMVAG